MSSPNGTASPIIWTPRFILLFVSLLTSGLSVASILTQFWLNGVLSAALVLLLYTAFALGSSLLLIFKLQNPWSRAGGMLASVWCLLMGLHFAIPIVSEPDLHISLAAPLDIATQCAFLGSAACFSVSFAPLRLWDHYLFCLLPLIGLAIVVLDVRLTPSNLPTGSFNEGMIATALLYLAVIIWWFRPTNWRLQPGVAFLAGTIPVLQLLFTNSGYETESVPFFFTTVILLFFALLNIRLLQGEDRLFRRSRACPYPAVTPESHAGSE